MRKTKMGTRRLPRGWVLILLTIIILLPVPAQAEDYPGVYTSESSLIFIKSGDETGTLRGVTVLSYEYSMDWIITVGDIARINADGIIISDGYQYAYKANGQKLSETEFTSLNLTLDWDEYTFQILPSFGHFLAPMLRGGLAYSFIESRDGLPSQIALAQEAWDTGDSINLYDGFLYQIAEGEITAQVAYTEIAFGSRGVVRANFPDNFPPPPEDYPENYPDYPDSVFPPPVPTNNVDPTLITSDPTLPQGTLVDPNVAGNTPRFSLEAQHDYDVPPVKRIGIVQFTESADIDGYSPVCDQLFQDILGSHEDYEIVYIPWDEAMFGGAVMYDRAVWICEQYNVDVIILSELDQLKIPGIETALHQDRTVRVQLTIDTKMIDGTGGSEIWGGEFEADNMHDAYELDNGGDDLMIRTDIGRLLADMVGDLIDSGVLDGTHVD
jgi:hypothetical protein